MNMVNLILEVLTGVSGLAGLVTFVFALQGRSADKLSRPLRFTLALAFAAVSVMSAMAGRKKASADKSVDNSVRVPIVQTQPISPAETTVAVEKATVADRHQAMANYGIRPVSVTAPQTITPNVVAPLRSMITVGGAGRELPDVVTAADDVLHMLQPRFGIVRGEIRASQSAADDSLEGLITTDLTLDVAVRGTRDETQRRFTIRSRGGGFTNAASASQACDRLRHELQTKLDQERP